MEERRRRPVVWIILGVVCLAVLGVSGFMVWSTLDSAEDEAFAALREEVGAGDGEMIERYAELHDENSDLYGWVSIDGTYIDFPVMWTPNDPEFYLHHSFDKTESQSGVPFMDANCYPGSGMSLIYGHHMGQGRMFASLMENADYDYWQAHPIIKFDTLYDSGEYELLGAFYSRVYEEWEQQDPENFVYYAYTDLTDPQIFQHFVDEVKANAVYDTGVTAEYGDELVALSTCAYHVENGRFVIVGRKIKD